jgi:hypothetical protein
MALFALEQWIRNYKQRTDRTFEWVSDVEPIIKRLKNGLLRKTDLSEIFDDWRELTETDCQQLVRVFEDLSLVIDLGEDLFIPSRLERVDASEITQLKEQRAVRLPYSAKMKWFIAGFLHPNVTPEVLADLHRVDRHARKWIFTTDQVYGESICLPVSDPIDIHLRFIITGKGSVGLHLAVFEEKLRVLKKA